jgi:chemotaxis signal transduction protein
MRMIDLQLSDRATLLRLEFDGGFAEPPRTRESALVDLLAVRVGRDAYALRLSEVTGLYADRTLTQMPGASVDFLGIAGFRGAVVPVYDLRVLLGHGGGEPPRWLVLAAAAAVGLAFDAFDGTLRLPSDALAAQAPDTGVGPHVREVVRSLGSGANLRALIDLGAVIESIRRRVRQASTPSQQE